MLFFILLALESEDDRTLMERYYDKYRQLIFKVAHDYLDDPQQDADCVQEALIGVIQSFQTFKKRSGNISQRSASAAHTGSTRPPAGSRLRCRRRLQSRRRCSSRPAAWTILAARSWR